MDVESSKQEASERAIASLLGRDPVCRNCKHHVISIDRSRGAYTLAVDSAYWADIEIICGFTKEKVKLEDYCEKFEVEK